MARGPSRESSPTIPLKKIGKKSTKKDTTKMPIYLTYAAVIFIAPVLIAYIGHNIHQKYFYLPSLVVTPSDLPKALDSNAFGYEKSPERFWGTYRSNLYFGLRTRSANSPVFGIMWYKQPRIIGQQIEQPQIRHWCDSGDKIRSYGWNQHDGITFGSQKIHDRDLEIETSFIKSSGGKHGGEWSARVKLQPNKASDPSVHHVIIYMALPDWSNSSAYLRPLVAGDENSHNVQAIEGFTQELGKFRLRMPESPKIVKRSFLASKFKKMDFSQLKEQIMGGMGVAKGGEPILTLVGFLEEKTQADRIYNLVAVQLTFAEETSIDIAFESESADSARKTPLVAEEYSKQLEERSKSFNDKFERIFDFGNKNFPGVYMEMGKLALSNMLGSIGYFHGNSVVKSEHTPEPVLYGPLTLFSGVPSRPFFPRGFLWDEGFHQLLISKWDLELSMEIIGSWIDLMNIQGWIPREMILGAEAEVRVPAEFIVQRDSVANPPVFFHVLNGILHRITDEQSQKKLVEKLYPRLKLWYTWLNNSQSGPEPGSYRWRGRNETTKFELNPKTLPSGLDDYPRASHPSSKEYHLDLYCWMAISSKAMATMAKLLGQTNDLQIFESHAKFLADTNTLDNLHWSEKSNRYADFGLHTRNVKLEKPKPQLSPDGRPKPGVDSTMIRQMLSEPKYRLVTDTFGYVSLYPFFMRLIPNDSPKLGLLLDQLLDQDLLWTPFGLRSLAKNAPQYATKNTEHDPPYWRGNIWVNMNYLALASLHHYASFNGPYREKSFDVYGKLRGALVGNMVREMRSSGYLWENYNDSTGKGQGTHPFTGWSSLVMLIMSEQYE